MQGAESERAEGERAADRWLQSLPHEGETARLLRRFDWSGTALGPIESWSQALRISVSTVMGSRFPLLLCWGPELVQIYNEGYVAIFGSKHPRSFGESVAQTWSEIYDVVGPLMDGVHRTGEATWAEDQQLFINRLGFPEDTYFTFSYSPVRDEHGASVGLLAPAIETTAQFVDARRMRCLESLAAASTSPDGLPVAAAAVTEVLARHRDDVLFAAVYQRAAGSAHLLAACGAEAGGPLLPVDVDLDRAEPLPLGISAPLLLDDLTTRVAEEHLPRGLLDLRVGAVRLVPLRGLGPTDVVLVLGLSPTRRIDADYLGFCDLVAGHVGNALSTAERLHHDRRRTEELEALDRAKTEFFASVSHEFRTPLTLVLGPVQDVLADGTLGDQDRGRLEIVLRNASRLLRLVDALMDFARGEQGRLDARFAPVDLALVTADLTAMFRAACESAGLDLSVTTDLREPARSGEDHEPTYVDVHLWEHVVINLLANALRHTFTGGIRVHLDEVAEGGVDGVRLRVSDTGVGIPADQLDRVFERFHRVAGARARTQEGSGIGLALAQQVVDVHGGTIGVTSEEGVGTTVTVVLPRGRSHLPAEQVLSEPTGDRRGSPRRSVSAEAGSWVEVSDGGQVPPDDGRPLVLVVDDNADMRAHIGGVLDREYRVAFAADGAAGLRAAQASPPDLIVTDVMMPGVDGLTLLRELRFDAALGRVPVVVVTARDGSEAAVEGLDAGADDYLAKPFTSVELLARVRANLELSAARRRLAQLEGS